MLFRTRSTASVAYVSSPRQSEEKCQATAHTDLCWNIRVLCSHIYLLSRKSGTGVILRHRDRNYAYALAKIVLSNCSALSHLDF